MAYNDTQSFHNYFCNNPRCRERLGCCNEKGFSPTGSTILITRSTRLTCQKCGKEQKVFVLVATK